MFSLKFGFCSFARFALYTLNYMHDTVDTRFIHLNSSRTHLTLPSATAAAVAITIVFTKMQMLHI